MRERAKTADNLRQGGNEKVLQGSILSNVARVNLQDISDSLNGSLRMSKKQE